MVPLYTPGNAAASSWNQVYAGAPRSFGPNNSNHSSDRSGSSRSGDQEEEAIDYVFLLHATNDGLRGAKAGPVSASVSGFLSALRKEVGVATHIFLTVPFGGFGANLAPQGSLKAGFDAYMKQQQSIAILGGEEDGEGGGDSRAHYIDLGSSAARGLTGFNLGATVEGCGGIHPRGGTKYAARHGELGAMLVGAATRMLLQ